MSDLAAGWQLLFIRRRRGAIFRLGNEAMSSSVNTFSFEENSCTPNTFSFEENSCTLIHLLSRKTLVLRIHSLLREFSVLWIHIFWGELLYPDTFTFRESFVLLKHSILRNTFSFEENLYTLNVFNFGIHFPLRKKKIHFFWEKLLYPEYIFFQEKGSTFSFWENSFKNVIILIHFLPKTVVL